MVKMLATTTTRATAIPPIWASSSTTGATATVHYGGLHGPDDEDPMCGVREPLPVGPQPSPTAVRRELASSVEGGSG